MSKGKNGSISFADLKRLRGDVDMGKVQIIRPDQADEQRAVAYIGELREFWRKRGEWAHQLSMNNAEGGHPEPDPAELMRIASDYAKAEWKQQLQDCLDVLDYLGRPVPEQIAFAAHYCGIEVKAKETDAKTLVPVS